MRKRVGIPLLLLLLASLSLVWALAPSNYTTTTGGSRRDMTTKQVDDVPSSHPVVQGVRVSNEEGTNRRRRTQFQARHAHITPPQLFKPVVACAVMAAPDFLPQVAQSLEKHLDMAKVVTSSIMVAMTVIPSMFLMTRNW